MAIQLSSDANEAARNAAADAVAALCDGGTIEIRTGSPPASADDADSGTLLAVLTLNATAFGAASLGEILANSITSDSSANATGTAGHFRVKDSSSNVVFQGTAGEAADSPDLTLNNKSIVAAGTVAATSMALTF